MGLPVVRPCEGKNTRSLPHVCLLSADWTKRPRRLRTIRHACSSTKTIRNKYAVPRCPSYSGHLLSDTKTYHYQAQLIEICTLAGLIASLIRLCRLGGFVANTTPPLVMTFGLITLPQMLLPADPLPRLHSRRLGRTWLLVVMQELQACTESG